MSNRSKLRFCAFVMCCGVARPARASFHLMQIEQVIGGVGGDTSAQAIQLRMRMGSQQFVSSARLVVRDANGANPIILDLTTNVAIGTAGSRVLIATPNFASHTTPAAIPNFTFPSLIPDSYLAAGTLTWEQDPPSTNVFWRLSWGGAAYAGPCTGAITNDVDGNFCPPVPGALPSGTAQALRFPGAVAALSTNNAADYAVTTGAATFFNNAGASFVVNLPPPTCTTCRGDLNGDSLTDAADIASFAGCILTGSPTGAGCICADMDNNGTFDQSDVDQFVDKILNAGDPPACQ